MYLQAINPFNGKLIRQYKTHSEAQTDSKIRQAHKAFEQWRSTNFRDRAAYLRRIAKALRNQQETLARLMAVEMGKPLRDGRAELEKCAWVCEYYAQNAAQFLKDELVATDASKSYVSFQALGVILAVMPWNFPFWQVFRFLAPALMAGNTALLKHASNVPGCAIAIEKLVDTAGLPSSVFQTLLIPSTQVATVIEHPLVQAVSLTGSTEAGQKVAAKAGSLIKKTVLELGGSDPYLVLEDADLEQAAAICAQSRLINSGQSCIAAKRFIVVKTVQKPFERLFVQHMAAARMGNPLDENTTLGPQARTDLRDQLHDQVQRSIQAGARLLLGGTVPPGEGAFYPATVLSQVKPGMPAFEEELFGPVAAIITARNREEAIRLANQSRFGLGAAIFSKNIRLADQIAARQLAAGACFVNASVKSDPRLPFGGIKQSGYGRELGLFGIREFVNIKTVYIA